MSAKDSIHEQFALGQEWSASFAGSNMIVNSSYSYVWLLPYRYKGPPELKYYGHIFLDSLYVFSNQSTFDLNYVW